MKYYHLLSRFKFLNKYSYKFLFVSFVRIHIPLIGLILLLVLGPEVLLQPGTIIDLTLLLTLAATGITLYILHQLIAPIRVVKTALHEYLTHQKLPVLPTHYQDEVGFLLHDVQHTVTEVNALLEDKKDLLATLSHDLRNPIHNIQQAVTLARKGGNPVMLEKYYQFIEKAAQQQLDLIQTVIRLWEHESNKVQLYQLEPVPVGEVLKKVLKHADLKLIQKQLLIQNQVSPQHLVNAEPNLLKEIIDNLLLNAIKFSRPGGTIRIASEKSGDRLKVLIEDQGLGFHPNHAEALFERFTPHRRKGANGEDTIGMGLYLCRKMLQKQAGNITAYIAGKNQDALFTLDLKAAPAAGFSPSAS